MTNFILGYELENSSDVNTLRGELLSNSRGYVDEIKVTEKDQSLALKKLPNTTLAHTGKTRDVIYHEFTETCNSLSIQWVSFFVLQYNEYTLGLFINK